MAYEKPITIKESISYIQSQDYILPSIQREFVWQPDQIELLFDSILRDYPISTFLFWLVKGENLNKFKFYRFLPFYHERDKRHNEAAEITKERDRYAILDGQQRLTSLYIGLKGSYSKKLKNFKWTSSHAFPKRKLYLDLLNPAADNDKLYNFKFLSDKEITALNEKHPKKYHWFLVGDILDFNDFPDIFQYISENSLMDTSIYSSDEAKFASDTLSKLFQYFNQKEIINFYLEKSNELDKVLHIFIRVNSGGTKLSYSDLLLSIATAQWKKKDAREIIHSFVDQINNIDPGFNISKDLVLKSCLVLTDLNDVKFKVDNFTSENMKLIEEQWDNISKALSLSIQLIASFGFSQKTLTADNAIIPIAYFLKKNNIGDEILHASGQAENRKLIKEWLIRALLKRVFGGTPDSLYPIYRNIISQNGAKFPLEKLIERYSGSNKSLSFSEENIDNLLEVKYGSSSSYMLLSLLYPLNHNYKFHQDHIHPKKFFKNKTLEKMGVVNETDREFCISKFNDLPNLQLIQETENLEKNAKEFKDWLFEKYNTLEIENYKNLHLIPHDNDLTLVTFPSFFSNRRDLMKSRLMQILNVKHSAEENVDELEEIEDILSA